MTLDGWRDTSRSPEDRAEDLLARLSLREKLGQLAGVWIGGAETGQDVAPSLDDEQDAARDWRAQLPDGIGQLTRPFGSNPVDPATGARALAHVQAEIVAAGRHGIPALAHEECLAGFTTWQATIFPVPLAWGACFDPDLVGRMAAAIGSSLHAVGVHQGLAPVLDVTRDYRWGRVEETIGEDPCLVATIGTAYVRGLQSAGIVATLKHFAGYAGSRAGRNHAPVPAGPREMADVILPPFELAVVSGGVRSVMHSYAEVDGMPPAADAGLLTGVLRERWGFTGTVVADYFGISFLETNHGLAADASGAGALALRAGVDVELPSVRCYGEPLLAAVETGLVEAELVNRAVRRVLLQKAELGLLDPDWSPTPPGLRGRDSDARIDLDPAAHRAIAREVAEKSLVLLRNDGVLPLAPDVRVALVGPRGDDPLAMMGCYAFPAHVLVHHEGVPLGVDVATLAAALRAQFPAWQGFQPGCDTDGPSTAGIAAAVGAARAADVVVVALGDRAGLFGLGTSGEGCDAEDLRLPGVQGELLQAVLGTGTPVVLVLLAGRPYALGPYAERCAAIVQGFFPGEEGGPAVARLLAGEVCPSGRLPVSVPRSAGGSPQTYLAPTLGRRTAVSTVDPTPAYAFGHGLSYTSFAWEAPVVTGGATRDGLVELATDGSVTIALTVGNTGAVRGAEVVQAYLHDPVASVTRPVVRLVAFARVELDPGQSRVVTLTLSADLTCFTGVEGHRIVEPGDLEFRLGASSVDVRHRVRVRLVGPVRQVDSTRVLAADVRVG